MEEPTYSFRKGVGWVTEGAVDTWTTEVSNHLGKFLVTLYARKPEIGEHYYQFYKERWNSSDYQDANGEFVLEKCWEGVKDDMRYRPMDMGGCHDELNTAFLMQVNVFCMTIVVEQLEAARPPLWEYLNISTTRTT